MSNGLFSRLSYFELHQLTHTTNALLLCRFFSACLKYLKTRWCPLFFFFNSLVMFIFPLLCSIILVTVFANPIPADSKDLGDLTDNAADGLNESDDLTLEQVTLNTDEVTDTAKNPAIPTVTYSVPVVTSLDIVTDSSHSTSSACTLDVPSDGFTDVIIQKRFKVCPVTDTPKPPRVPQPVLQPPTEKSKPSTTNSNNPCGFDKPKYVSCGGDEYISPYMPHPLIGIIPNCVLGKFLFFLLLSFANLTIYSGEKTYTRALDIC